jgi:hypothetical protein
MASDEGSGKAEPIRFRTWKPPDRTWKPPVRAFPEPGEAVAPLAPAVPGGQPVPFLLPATGARGLLSAEDVRDLLAEPSSQRPTVNREPEGLPPVRHHGPRPIIDRADVERARSELAGEWHGERSVAGRLGVSRDAVRYALGKDRRRKRGG